RALPARRSPDLSASSATDIRRSQRPKRPPVPGRGCCRPLTVVCNIPQALMSGRVAKDVASIQRTVPRMPARSTDGRCAARETTVQKPRKAARRKGQAVTLDEVAALAKVSPMTVSRVVNGQGKVRDSTRDRVMRAVRE